MSIAKTLRYALVPAAALAAALSVATVKPAGATDWVYYSPQSSPQYITPRAAQMFVDKVKEATNGELEIKFRLFGSLSIQQPMSPRPSATTSFRWATIRFSRATYRWPAS